MRAEAKTIKRFMTRRNTRAKWGSTSMLFIPTAILLWRPISAGFHFIESDRLSRYINTSPHALPVICSARLFPTCSGGWRLYARYRIRRSNFASWCREWDLGIDKWSGECGDPVGDILAQRYCVRGRLVQQKSTPLRGTSTPANRIARRAASEAEGSIPIVKELPGSRSRRFFAFQTCQVD